MIAAILPYLRDLNPAWTAVSFAVALMVWAVAKRHRWAISFTALWLYLVYSSTELSRSESVVSDPCGPIPSGYSLLVFHHNQDA